MLGTRDRKDGERHPFIGQKDGSQSASVRLTCVIQGGSCRSGRLGRLSCRVHVPLGLIDFTEDASSSTVNRFPSTASWSTAFVRRRLSTVRNVR